MTRKLNRNYSLSLVVPFIAILILLIAAAVLAQTSGASPADGKANAVLAQAGASASAQAKHPLTPWTDGTGGSAVGRSHTKRHGARPMDSGSLLFLFMPAVDYGAGGGYTWSVAVADLRGDGKLDVIVANDNSDNVGVLLGNGDGTFQPVATYGSGGSVPWSVAVADVNGDGKPDIVVANDYSDNVGVLLGNGDGTFQPAVTYNSGGSYPPGVAIADVNGDGKPDLIVSNSQSNTVGVLLGNGDGTFQPAVTYNAGSSPYWIVVADLNGDGKPDLVVSNYYGAVAVLSGNGDGTFQPAVTYGTGGYPSLSVAVADVNRDGKPDLLVADYDTGTVGVLLGNGDGTFQTVVTYGCSSAYCQSVAAADINGDGYLDLVAGTSYGVVLMLGNGDGTFQPPVDYPSGGSYDDSVVAVDLNGDGMPDVVVANTTASTVGVLLNNSGAPPTTTSLVSSVNPANLLEVVTYTATVTSQSGGSVTGTVTFQDGGATIATVPLANNQAVYSTSYTKKQVGTHAITATYWGELHNAYGSMSNTVTEDIGKLPIKTTTVLTTSGSPSYDGQPVTFTATITPKQFEIPDGELVTFYDLQPRGGTVIGTGTTASGVATCVTSSLTVKTHKIKAIYPGDAAFKPSAGTVGQVVDRYPTTTALSSSLNPSSYGQVVTFTATVTSSGPEIPTGSVEFKDGTKTIGVATLSAGVAALTKSDLAVGTHPITARYEGDDVSATSTSPVLDQVVQ
jgi:hypothetical protein